MASCDVGRVPPECSRDGDNRASGAERESKSNERGPLKGEKMSERPKSSISSESRGELDDIDPPMVCPKTPGESESFPEPSA